MSSDNSLAGMLGTIIGDGAGYSRSSSTIRSNSEAGTGLE